MLATYLLWWTLPALAIAQGCPGSPSPVNSITPVVQSGWKWSIAATGLTQPRTIRFDNYGRLLVVERGVGVTSLDLQDNGGGCVSEKARHTVVSESDLNHGLAFSTDFSLIYASSSATAWSWSYNSDSHAASNKKTIIANMDNSDHNTRTLQMSSFIQNQLIVSRGSDDNIDPGAAYLSTGRSQIRSFDMSKTPTNGYDYSTAGLRLGWGLRNSVGVMEHPLTGEIYSVENSCDNFLRDGQDVHQDNPGEEMNAHGTLLHNTDSRQGSNFGYPNCFSAWNASDLPENSHIRTGTPFTNSSSLDHLCDSTTPAVLTFQAHMAPLDLKFNSTAGDQAWVTFHGSWDRSNPSGYKVSMIDFPNGKPRMAPSSMEPQVDIFTNADNSRCPNNCFRPVSLAFDHQDRLFVSSDGTGEIYVLSKT